MVRFLYLVGLIAILPVAPVVIFTLWHVLSNPYTFVPHRLPGERMPRVFSVINEALVQVVIKVLVKYSLNHVIN